MPSGARTLEGLVNNAGVALPAPLVYQPIAEFREQIEVNLIGPLIVTQAFVGLLGKDHSTKGPPGRIVNVSSIGGKIAGPFIGAYHASKFGLEGLGSLRRELMLSGSTSSSSARGECGRRSGKRQRKPISPPTRRPSTGPRSSPSGST